MDATSSPLDPELLLAHAGFVRSVARSLLVDESAVDDVVQQTWLTALERPPREPGALRRWLARVARSVVREARRSDERRMRREAATAPNEVDPLDPAHLVERLARMRALTDAVLELPALYRDAVVRRHLEELSPAEIARRDGVPVATIETRLKRARKQLRERLEVSYGIGKDALALLVTGVKAGVTWKAATLAAAATVALAGAATWRVVAAMRAPTVEAAAASVGLGSHGHAPSSGAAPTPGAGGDPLVANVSEVEPRLEWPDEGTLRRMEQRGRALFGGIVSAPDGTPCVGAEVRCEGALVAKSDARGAWRADVAIDPPEFPLEVASPLASDWRAEATRLLLIRKEGVGVAIVEVAAPSRRIDLRMNEGHSFTAQARRSDDGRRVADVDLEVRLDVRCGQSHPGALTLASRADHDGEHTFANLPDSSLWIAGRTRELDSNGFLGFDFSHGRDLSVRVPMGATFQWCGQFAPWPCAGIDAGAALVEATARSPHDGVSGGTKRRGAVAADGRFELALPVCSVCAVALLVGDDELWGVELETNLGEGSFDVGTIAVTTPRGLSGRVDLPVDLDRSLVSFSKSVRFRGWAERSVAADGSFRTLLPFETSYPDFEVTLGRSVGLSYANSSRLTQAERENGYEALAEGEVRDVGIVTLDRPVIYGTVRDERGDPVAGASVLHLGDDPDGSSRGDQIEEVGTVDASGRYLGALDERRLKWSSTELEVVAPGFAPQRFPFFALADARWLRVDLVLKDGAALRGTLLDEAGAPCCGARVEIAEDFGSCARAVDRTRADGSFEIRGCAARDVALSVAAPGRAEQTFSGVHPGAQPLTLRLAAASKG